MLVEITPEQCMFDITYKCNLNCLHCYNRSGQEKNQIEELSDETMLEICKQLAELKTNNVCFCGGETLLKADFIIEGTKLLKSIYPQIKVNIVTNGLLLTTQLARNLKESGIDLVQISIDGGTSKSHDWLRNKNGAFSSALNALKILMDEKIQSSVAFCPTKKNIDELEKAVMLCHDLNVKLFRIQPLMLIGRAIDYLKNYEMSYREYRKVLMMIKNFQKNNLYPNMQFEWGDPIQYLTSYNIENLVNNTVLNINPYGDISISPYLPVNLGNVKKHSLIEYWNKELKKVWEARFLKDFCKIIDKNSSLDLYNSCKELSLDVIPLEIDILDTKEYKKINLKELIERNKKEC